MRSIRSTLYNEEFSRRVKAKYSHTTQSSRRNQLQEFSAATNTFRVLGHPEPPYHGGNPEPTERDVHRAFRHFASSTTRIYLPISWTRKRRHTSFSFLARPRKLC